MDGDGVVLGLQATIMLARQIRVNTAILGRIVPYMITGLLRQDHRKRPVLFECAAYKPGSVG